MNKQFTEHFHILFGVLMLVLVMMVMSLNMKVPQLTEEVEALKQNQLATVVGAGSGSSMRFICDDTDGGVVPGKAGAVFAAYGNFPDSMSDADLFSAINGVVSRGVSRVRPSGTGFTFFGDTLGGYVNGMDLDVTTPLGGTIKFYALFDKGTDTTLPTIAAPHEPGGHTTSIPTAKLQEWYCGREPYVPTMAGNVPKFKTFQGTSITKQLFNLPNYIGSMFMRAMAGLGYAVSTELIRRSQSFRWVCG